MKRDSSSTPISLEENRQFNEPNQTRPITSGPTQYPGGDSSLSKVHVVLQWIVQCYDREYMKSKKTISYTLFQHQRRNQNYCRGDWKAVGINLLILLISHISLAFVWSTVYYNYQPYRTRRRFKFGSSGYCWTGFILFIMESLSVIICMTLVYIKREERDMRLIFIPFSILLAVNILIFLNIHCSEIVAHAPMWDMNNYFLISRNEKSHKREKSLTIRESGPFRIVIENCGRNNFTDTMFISRQVIWRKGSSWRPNWTSNNVSFGFVLRRPLEPGEIITLIPEPHVEEGAYRIEGFRSFGRARGECIITTVNKNFYMNIVKLEEKYDCNEELAIRMGLRRTG